MQLEDTKWSFKDSYDPDYKEKLEWWCSPHGGKDILSDYKIYAMSATASTYQPTLKALLS